MTIKGYIFEIAHIRDIPYFGVLLIITQMQLKFECIVVIPDFHSITLKS